MLDVEVSAKPTPALGARRYEGLRSESGFWEETWECREGVEEEEGGLDVVEEEREEKPFPGPGGLVVVVVAVEVVGGAGRLSVERILACWLMPILMRLKMSCMLAAVGGRLSEDIFAVVVW